ncbi:unnamed protein product [Heterosigma akashiwo]|mmetsp:Transcript_1612/g.2327  ORF Transcript_1612/g.2327 Transcript_1612/m.2327 type:complete len:120 (+) Transcript_1612:84-443(+)
MHRVVNQQRKLWSVTLVILLLLWNVHDTSANIKDLQNLGNPEPEDAPSSADVWSYFDHAKHPEEKSRYVSKNPHQEVEKRSCERLSSAAKHKGALRWLIHGLLDHVAAFYDCEVNGVFG